MNIITDLDLLRQAASPLEFYTEQGISTEEGLEIISKLKTVMEEHSELMSLAAPQLGISKRIFCIRFDDRIKFFIDPIITKKDKYQIAPETFASMPGKEILIARPEEITVIYYTEDFKYEDNKLLGPAARLFDQLCQLLDGILPDVLGLVSDINTDGSLAELSDEEIQEVIKFYSNYIKVKLDSISQQITEDPALTEQYKQLDFAEKVINGHAAVLVDSDPGRKSKVNKLVNSSMKALGDQQKLERQANLKKFLAKRRR